MVTSERRAAGALVPLQKGARYLTPSSRLAVWLGETVPEDGGAIFSTFAYVPEAWEPQTMDERFTLAEANYGLLVKVAR